MSATIHGVSRFGLTDDSSASGLILGNVSYNKSAETAFVKNHVGNDVGVSMYNDSVEVTCDGVVAVKATGITLALADALTLANTATDSLDLLDDNIFTTSVANAGLIVSGLSLTRSNTEFETGSITALYRPLIENNASTTVS